MPRLKIYDHKSLSLLTYLNSIGNKETPIKNNNKAIIDGENISLTDSTKYNCLPAKA